MSPGRSTRVPRYTPPLSGTSVRQMPVRASWEKSSAEKQYTLPLSTSAADAAIIPLPTQHSARSRLIKRFGNICNTSK